MFLFQFGQLGGDAFQLGLQLVDGGLLLGEVAGDDQRLGDRSQAQPLSFSLPFLSFSMMR